jgi:hypothetical protein
MNKKVLLIEDDKNKVEKVIQFLAEYDIIVKDSFQSGIKELKQNSFTYLFLILDMTIPMWEKGENDLGGNYEQFGGERILREMKRKNVAIPTILFTMFDVFPTKERNITFQELNDIYKERFNSFYIGGVYYNSTDEYWKIEMSNQIKIINERN